ncbi:hypothetical protein [Streptomyces sp. NPDC058145]|uniref:hypothetical protein n=1 Tax=Streptomyces sp. NPDC058145 TaxID=3346356 RepID=UPI0036ED6C01
MPYFFVGVPAESFDEFGCRFRVVQGQLAHSRVRIVGVAEQVAAGEVRMAVGAIGGAEAAGPPLPHPQQHVGGGVVAGFGEEELDDTVLVAGQAFHDVRWKAPGPGDASAHEGMGGSGQAAHGITILVQCHDPVERVIVDVGVEVDVDARPLILGEIGAIGHLEAHGYVRVQGEEAHQVRVQVRVAREETALCGIAVLGQVLGEVALQAAGPHRVVRVVPESSRVEDRAGHRVVLVVTEQRLDADLAVGVVEKRRPGQALQMGPGSSAGRGAYGRIGVTGQGDE